MAHILHPQSLFFVVADMEISLIWRRKFLLLLTLLNAILIGVVDKATNNKVAFYTMCGTFSCVLPVEVSVAMLFYHKRCKSSSWLALCVTEAMYCLIGMDEPVDSWDLLDSSNRWHRRKEYSNHKRRSFKLLHLNFCFM